MVFFDLNVPHLEGGGLDKPLADNTNRKNTRLRIVVKAMELGYTGVAYNRSMKGLMSDSDRCTITPFPISSLLKVAPSLSSSVKFHRELLGVPLNSPFRQYTRLTVSIDNMIQANALNSGNPVLKTYDLVAVRPLNQIVFEQACKVSEVDLIAIDFSDKLPFRLKLPMVKAAIERGVYFEITYSHLISDVQARRQMVQNAKLLVDWTRGKNLIFTSAASSVNEIRGPYDVANLSSLLGLSVERAKAAISKNCSSLLSRALRKKQFYKEAVRVERVSSSTQLDSKDPWFADCPSWDRISSSDGDLMFDDIAKFFSESSKEPKTSKSIDFASITKELPSNGMKLKDWLPVGGEKLQPPNASSCLPAAEPGGSDEVKKGLKQSNEPEVVTVAGPMSLFSNPLKNQNSSYQGFVEPRNDTSKVYTDAKEIEITSSFYEEPTSSNKLDAVSVAGGITLHDMSSQECVLNREGNLTFPDDVAAETSSMCNVDSEGSSRFDLVSSSKGFVSTTECDLVSPMDTFEQSVPPKDNELPSRDEDSGSLDNPDTVLGADYVNMGKCLTETEDREQIRSVSTACDMSIDTYLINGQPKDSQFLLADDKLLGDSRSGMQGDVALTADAGAPEVPSVEIEEETGKEFTEINRQEDDESKSGKARFKHRQKSNRALPFPLKHLLKPVVFKKKSKKSKNRGNKTQLQRNYTGEAKSKLTTTSYYMDSLLGNTKLTTANLEAFLK